jgi:hypothetical protein
MVVGLATENSLRGLQAEGDLSLAEDVRFERLADPYSAYDVPALAELMRQLSRDRSAYYSGQTAVESQLAQEHEL